MINIVIDADIASAAGTTAHPVSSSCRLLLNLVHDNGHSVSYCKKLRKEWDDHQSHYFIDWRALMFTKKRLHLINHNEDFNTSIAASDAADEIKAIACKDSHLLDIAAANGRSIASQDEKAKAAFMQFQK